jgi:hypothetical protein
MTPEQEHGFKDGYLHISRPGNRNRTQARLEWTSTTSGAAALATPDPVTHGGEAP